MRCKICNKNEGIIHGILNNEVIPVCSFCSRTEGIPIVKRPTQEQLEKANQRYSVKERMMKISGMDKLNPVSRDHETAQRHLGKLKIPEKVQESHNLVENYNWNIKIARRRRKVSLSQIAQETNVPVEILDSFEKGILVKDYEKVAEKLEKVLGIPLLKSHQKSIRFIMPAKKEQEIPVINSKDKSLEDLEIEELKKSVKEQELRQQFEKQQAVHEIKHGQFDFSDKKKTQNITLDDLIKAKKEREAKAKKEREEFLGSDLELEE